MNRRDAGLHLAMRYPGGIEAVAPRMGKRPDTLRKELTGVHGYKWGIDDEELLIAICLAAGVKDALAPITAAAVNAGAMVIPLPSMEAAGSSFQAVASTAREFGEFMGTMADAAADGRITGNEVKRIDREASELVAAVQRCVSDMHALHEAGKPTHLRAA